MAVRETLNRNATAVAGSAIVVILVALAVISWRNFSRPDPIMAKAFFTDDDGKTWFVDDAANLTPFDHDGKPAVRCYVYQTDKGNMFVACEAELPDAVRQELMKES